MLNDQEKCPCGRDATYGNCCGRFHTGSLAAPTAAELMRSRYTAYTLANVPYLIATTHSSLAPHTDPVEVRKFAEGVEWKRLEVVDVERGKMEDAEGFVEFRAWYKTGGRLECLWERSKFLREEGKWKYHSGSHQQKTPKIGRNDACPCGSGKKHKKCCG